MRALTSLGLILAACNGGSQANVSCDPPRGPAFPGFADITLASGIRFQYQSPDFRGGALAVADLDGDGLPEILAARRDSGVQIFHNLGALHFEPIDLGVDPALGANAIAAVDLDNDGDLDLVLAGPNLAVIYERAGDRYREAARLADTGTTEHILAVDLDGDGRLDLYFGNHDTDASALTRNKLVMNRGGFQFTSGVVVGDGWTWTTTAFDVDGDGDQDLYVANDTLLADFGDGAPQTAPQTVDLVLRNDGVGSDGIPQFTDVAGELGMTQPHSSMGGVLADFDDDGTLQLYVPNYGAKKLYRRDGDHFVDEALPMGLGGITRLNGECTWPPMIETCLLLSWGTVVADFDDDGYDEVLTVNGSTVLGEAPPVLMFSRDAPGPFHEVQPDIACTDARGLVATDLDNDGDPDIVIAPKTGLLLVYENQRRPAPTSWLRVVLHGTTSNRDGAGAIVRVQLASGRVRTKIVGSGGILNTSVPFDAVFGLGDDTIERIDVQWPSGVTTQVANPHPGTVIATE